LWLNINDINNPNVRVFGVGEKRATGRIFGLKICKKRGAGLIQQELHHFCLSLILMITK